ncbi:hypothetical protein A9Z42_0010950 [Trichoderma parareesei]|uniref:Uncharacterized protein n=1 Tax=Trichoderma parareesei TaxID=858221 RepID=A0A2H2ZES7_TRIPA|nr:hypothetical protein A9Z42_0010950 [Trichoderma parareesei]
MSPNPLFARDETDCLPGTTFYSCVANRFRGCCSTDPCALRSCPDGVLFKASSDLNGGPMPSKTQPEPDRTKPTPTDDDDQSRQREEESTSSRPTPTSKKSATMTDSGITHTIPNNSIVTITRHTTITTGRPTTTPSDTSDLFSPSTTDVPLTGTISATSDITPAPSSTNAETTASPSASSSSAASPLSTGVIVGIAIGGAVVIAILVVLGFALLRRRKKQQSGSETASVVQQDTGRDEVVEDKHFPQTVSAHTTGTQASSDPFAPFGGNGTFEMDGTSAAPVELPAVSASSPGPSTHNNKGTRLEPVQEITAADPRANLTPGPADDGKPVYVNHWNQYKNLG